MKLNRRRKCRNCKELFYPDRRNVRSQHYCGKEECRKASKAASQKRWLKKPGNRNYFKGPENVARVREWREKHPGYWKRKAAKPRSPLQDVLFGQGTKNTKESGQLTKTVLQDVLSTQPPLIIGLIAQLNGSALQDDIAESLRNLVRLGHDIVGGEDDKKENYLSRAHETCPEKIQLGGPASGP